MDGKFRTNISLALVLTNMLKKIIIFSLLMNFTFGFTQETKGAFAMELNEAYKLTKHNPQLSIVKHQQIFEKAKNASDDLAMMQAQLQLVISYNCLDNNHKVIEHVLILQDLAQKNQNFFYLCSALQYKAYAISYADSFVESRRMFKDIFAQSQNIKELSNRNLIQANLYQTKALVFFQDSIMPIDSTYSNIKKSVRLFEQFSFKKRYNSISESYRILGECYALKKQNDSAVYYLNQALKIAEANQNTFGIIYAECGFGNYFYQNYDDQNAVKHFQKAIDRLKGYGNDFLLHYIYTSLSDTYFEMGEIIKGNEILEKKTALAEKLVPIQAKSREETIKLLTKQSTEGSANKYFDIKIIVYVIFVSTILLLIIILFLLKRYNQTTHFTEQQAEIISKQKKELDTLSKVKEKDLKKLYSLAKIDSPLFLGRGKELYPDFFTMLNQIQPGLTLPEQKFSFYLKLGFTTQQIAEINQVSIKAIQSRKSRLRKRLSLDATVDLYQYLQNIDAHLI
ncbi:hypothetical protein GV828_12660 [Flavobacterium sp. NST-5]|uniref:HTH luxR-type domain-containing protein n=1 Tax=Flavobacterium ichthyis TaxID=2698827 RepID=A0ABW9ZE67_9FLAO|nr:tetratricopeptide repeat protein [Flavobacterium ichthyis]NBL66049.1 hypothetical protein [Flavobacterium ichthyis]